MFRIYLIYVLLCLGLLIAEVDVDFLVISTSVFSFIILFNKVGNGIFFRELIFFHVVLICILAPWLGYTVYTIENPIAKLWQRFMPIPKQQYFDYLLPACWFYGLGLLWPAKSVNDTREQMLVWRQKLPAVLERVPLSYIHILLIAGLLSKVVSPFLGGGLQQVLVFINFSFFTACFYVFYHPATRRKWPYILVLGAYMLYTTLSGGMFTLIVNMGAIIIMLVLLTVRISNLRKFLMFATGFSLIIFIQFFKMGYRQATWGTEADSKTEAINSALLSSSVMFSKNSFTDAAFPIYYRMNQGFNIARVIKYIPNQQPFAGGYELGLAFASAFVPRFIWADKPTAGGQYNMQRYTGITIRTYSTNVSPIGEGYGNFGITGGVIYCFFFALFLRLAYIVFLRQSFKNPVLLFWMPVIFFQIIYVAENDSLQAFNSLIKGVIYIAIMRFLFPVLFYGLPKKQVNAG